MKKYQKALRHILAAGTAAALLVTATAPASAANELPFTDVSGQYTNGVGHFYTYNLVDGTSARTFGTNNSIKRGDTAVIVARALYANMVNPPDAGFTDVGRYAPAVNALFAEGIINGVSNTEFNPNGTLTRGAMAKILVEAFDIPAAEKKSPFKDAVGVFGSYVNALYAAGITGGKSEYMFGTNSDITRGEFVVLLYKTVMKYGYVIYPELAVNGVNDGLITKTAKQRLTIEASENSEVKVLVDNKEVTANAEGTYDITLTEGKNIITVTATLFGVETTVTKTVTLDTTPPTLIVSEIPEVVYTPTLALKFEAEPGAGVQVTVNGEVIYDVTKITLKEGKNTIVITVGDAAGNKSIVEKVITYVN